MAAGIVEGIPPAQEAEQVQKDFVQSLGAEYRAVTEFMRGYTCKEGTYCSVRKKGYEECKPGLLRPKEIHQAAGDSKQGEMSTGLKPSL
jgi:hypothetical protein